MSRREEKTHRSPADTTPDTASGGVVADETKAVLGITVPAVNSQNLSQASGAMAPTAAATPCGVTATLHTASFPTPMTDDEGTGYEHPGHR